MNETESSDPYQESREAPEDIGGEPQLIKQ
jgi:hypothetical protein